MDDSSPPSFVQDCNALDVNIGAAKEGVVPLKAIEWMTLHCTSNVELAILSNVCSVWRNVAYQSLGRVFATSLKKDDSSIKEGEELKRLLLPSMALELLRRGLPKNETISIKLTREKDEETFCLAWFEPKGIQMQSLCVNEDDDESDYEDDLYFANSATYGDYERDTTSTAAATADTHLSPLSELQQKQQQQQQQQYDNDDEIKEPFAPGGAPFYEGSEDEKQPSNNQQSRKKYNATTSSHQNNVSLSSSSAVPTVQFKNVQQQQKSLTSAASEQTSGGDNNANATSDANDNTTKVLQTCVYEWRGYRYATDVLIPLGYATVFIRRVLDMAAELLQHHYSSNNAFTDKDGIASSNSSNVIPFKETSSSSLHKHRWGGKSKEYIRTTFAVRGATLARPDNYCLCLDSLNSAESINNMSPPIREDFYEQSYTDSIAAADKHRRHFYRLRHSHAKQQQRRKKQKEMARLFLPRMVTSTKVKNPFVQSGSHSKDVILPKANDEAAKKIMKGKRTRCVQFLNVNGEHAVFLRTLPFECGTVKGPITLFLVGVATEDGCFVSGLKRRCEVGHLYPTSARDMLINMSPVCIATDSGCVDESENDNENKGELNDNATKIGGQKGMADLWEGVIENMNAASPPNEYSNMPATAAGFIVPSSSPMRNYSSSSYEGQDDSSDDSSESSENNGFKILCSCPFQSHDNENSDIHFSNHHHNHNQSNNYNFGGNYSEEDEEPPPAEEEYIYRGRMGPGLWHCYTVIFDGDESMIRVDGLLEPLHNGWPQQQDNDDEENYSKDKMTTNSSSSSRAAGSSSTSRVPAALDGLTIGSDHVFDMSLCYGDASDGEGEGTIAELVTFKGRMDLTDVECIERYLMEKHGIPPPPVESAMDNNDTATHSNLSRQYPNPSSPWQEDEWRRQAHALIVQPPPWRIEDKAVPLRVAAKHKSVAWHRTNDVTGKSVKISRIGSKYSTGSSDW